MDLQQFQQICIQRVKGEKTEIEFLREMREAFEKSSDGRGVAEPEVLRFLYDRLVDVMEDHDLTEQELLARQIEEWLNNPVMS